MSNQKYELWEDLDQLRDYAYTVKRAATDILDWCHVIETDMQAFIEEYTGPAFVPNGGDKPEPKPEPKPPVEPGSPCIDPDGEGCRCYEGCTADCLPSEYKACKCPRKIAPPMTPEPESDEPYYTLTEKGELIVKLIDQGYKYLEACQIADTAYEKKV